VHALLKMDMMYIVVQLVVLHAVVLVVFEIDLGTLLVVVEIVDITLYFVVVVVVIRRVVGIRD